MKNNIFRRDFETYICSSDGTPIEMNGRYSILYNSDIISDIEVEELLKNGNYRYDNRIVLTTQERADSLKGLKPSSNI